MKLMIKIKNFIISPRYTKSVISPKTRKDIFVLKYDNKENVINAAANLISNGIDFKYNHNNSITIVNGEAIYKIDADINAYNLVIC